MQKNERQENETKREKVDIERKIKRITALYLIVFLIVILLISLYINISSFRKQFISNELSFYTISGGRVVDNIENGLLYGKSLDNFYGIDRLLAEWKEKNRNVTDIRVLSADMQTTYWSLGDGSGKRQSAGSRAFVDESISLEIRDGEGTLCGHLNIAVDLKERLEVLQKIQVSFLAGAAVLLFAGFAAILLFCGKSSFASDDYRSRKKKILRFILLLILLLQVAFTIYSSVALRGFYIEISNNTGKEIRTLVQADIEKVIAKGVSYDKIYDFESYADDVVEKAPMIESIKLNGERLHVTISEKYIETVIRKMLLDMLTVLITSMFIAAETVNLMMISISRRMERITGTAVEDSQLSIRVSSFLIHVACYLPVSFIPILMYRFTGGSAGDFLLGLPVMVLFAVGVLFIVLAGGWSVRYGWRKLLFAGAALLIVSSLMAGLIANAAVLVVSRGIYGAAYSMIYIGIREFAAASQDRQTRSKGLAEVTAGLYAGINIGAVLGAVIYESAGFRGVFAISAGIGVLAFFVMKNICIPMKTDSREVSPEEGSAPFREEGKETLSVIKDREMLRLILFIIAPLAVASVFFEYFLPVYAVKEEIGSADIGRAFLVNGIAIAYVAPLIVKYFTAKINEKVSVFLFTALMAAGFLTFGFIGGLAGILIASAVMGIAEGVALVSQNMILLDLSVAEKAGTSRMLSIYATARKISQAIGPQIFAAFMLLGYEFGMVGFGAAVAACSVIYLWGARRNSGLVPDKGKGESKWGKM